MKGERKQRRGIVVKSYTLPLEDICPNNFQSLIIIIIILI
jgi:hypothetical protein